MNIGNHNRPHQLAALGYLTIALATLIVSSAACNPVKDTQSFATVTPNVAGQLTVTHRAEVSQAIERFERIWGSFEVRNNPALQEEVATAQAINDFGVKRRGLDKSKTDSWFVTRSAVVESVQVFEYDTRHFKAIACVSEGIDDVNADGTLRQSFDPQMTKKLYVFVREDNKWKLATLLNVIDPKDISRELEARAEWDRQLIGTVPDWHCTR